MTQPIGFFTSHTPGDGGIFDRLIATFGHQFQLMGQEEKYFFAGALLAWLGASDEKQMNEYDLPLAVNDFFAGEVPFSDELWNALEDVQELNVLELLGLVEAMIGQLKESHRQWAASFNSIKRSFQSAMEAQGCPPEWAEQAADILAYQQQSPGYQLTEEEQLIISRAWEAANIAG